MHGFDFSDAVAAILELAPPRRARCLCIAPASSTVIYARSNPLANSAAAASATSAYSAQPVLLFGIPNDFILFSLTLLGVALFHHKTLEVALSGLVAVMLYKLLFTGSGKARASPACCSSCTTNRLSSIYCRGFPTVNAGSSWTSEAAQQRDTPTFYGLTIYRPVPLIGRARRRACCQKYLIQHIPQSGRRRESKTQIRNRDEMI